jgi:imidazolonepropionase
VIYDGSLLVNAGVVMEVGTTRRIENLKLARQAIEVSAAGRVVMPGFVDCHTHLVFPPADSPAGKTGGQLVRGIASLRLETRARLHLEAMARHGTTTVEVKTGSGPEASAEAKLLRLLASLRPEPIELIPTFLLRPAAGGEEEGEARNERILLQLLPRIRRRRWAAFADFAWSESINTGFAERYLAAARNLGLACKLHVEDVPATRAISLGMAYGATSIDHLERATAADAALLANSNMVAILLPAASFQEDKPYTPARMLIDTGVAIALATNFNPAHTPVLNMQMVLKLACSRMGMKPEEAIAAATVNAAHALGRGGRTGSLAPGESADLLLLNVSDYRELAHAFGGNLVYSTMKRGQFIYKEGEVGPRPLDLRPAW